MLASICEPLKFLDTSAAVRTRVDLSKPVTLSSPVYLAMSPESLENGMEPLGRVHNTFHHYRDQTLESSLNRRSYKPASASTRVSSAT